MNAVRKGCRVTCKNSPGCSASYLAVAGSFAGQALGASGTIAMVFLFACLFLQPSRYEVDVGVAGLKFACLDALVDFGRCTSNEQQERSG